LVYQLGLIVKEKMFGNKFSGKLKAWKHKFSYLIQEDCVLLNVGVPSYVLFIFFKILQKVAQKLTKMGDNVLSKGIQRLIVCLDKSF